MTAYIISHAKGQHGDIRIADDGLIVTLTDAWACFNDADGSLAFAIPTEHIAAIQRVDEPQDQPAEE